MNNINEFEPNLHMAMITTTGGGKTTLASKIFKNLKHRAIFVDFQAEQVFDEHVWIRHTNMLEEAMRKSSKVVLRTMDTEQIDIMVRWIFDQKRHIPAFAETPVTIFFDEIHKYSHLQSIDDVFNMGRKWNIHGVLIVRKIQEMKNLSLISECREKIFLALEEVAVHKLKTNYDIRIPPVILNKLNSGTRNDNDKFQSDFNSALHDGFQWFLFDKNGNFTGRLEDIGNDENVVDDNSTENGEMPESKGVQKPEPGDETSDI